MPLLCFGQETWLRITIVVKVMFGEKDTVLRCTTRKTHKFRKIVFRDLIDEKSKRRREKGKTNACERERERERERKKVKKKYYVKD